MSQWRDLKVADVRAGKVVEGTRALLALALNEPDVAWLQTFLLECLNSNLDIQIRALAVTCVGHVARLHGEVSNELVSKLRDLLEDPVLGGQAEDAFDDITSFVE